MQQETVLVEVWYIHPFSQSLEPNLVQSQLPRGEIRFHSNPKGFQRVNLYLCERTLTHTQTHTRPIIIHTNKPMRRLCADTRILCTPNTYKCSTVFLAHLTPTSYCLLLSTEERAPASVAKGTGLNQMKPTGTEWHSHASVATDELTHTHALKYTNKNCFQRHTTGETYSKAIHNTAQPIRNIMFYKCKNIKGKVTDWWSLLSEESSPIITTLYRAWVKRTLSFLSGVYLRAASSAM